MNEHTNHVAPLESPLEYLKFTGVIAGIVLLAFLLGSISGGGLETYMTKFMAVFFLVFGLFKLIQLELFALTYQSYDIVAKRFKAWAYVFPFVELGLGVAYLLLGNRAWINFLTIAVTFTASIGVYREVRRKSVMKCACLGTVIRLPLSKVSLVEDVAMFVMAGIMLVI